MIDSRVWPHVHLNCSAQGLFRNFARSSFDWLFWKVGALMERGLITDENTAAHITETAF